MYLNQIGSKFSIFFISFLLACILLLQPAGCPAATEGDSGLNETVTITAGKITGVVLDGTVVSYKGIPYAAPPVASLRWKPPQPVKPWEGVLKATDYGPACSQKKGSLLFSRKYAKLSEDCLYLNIWTPAPSAQREKLPVMLWIHGGAFMIGSASDDFYQGKYLASKGVVVVTINYRLGPFGFLAHPLLSRESPQNVSGNYGLLDQIMALQWVRDNIAAFGGDSSRVTIFGESAGGRAVAHLMVSPLAKGLFHRAIMQSSSLYRPIRHLRETWYGRSSMEQVGAQVFEKLGIADDSDPLAALRSRDSDAILDAAQPRLEGVIDSDKEGSAYEPIVDGWVVPDDPSDLFDAGKQHKVPVIAGTVGDESTLFTRPMRFSRASKLKQLVLQVFPEHAPQVLKLFPMEEKKEAFKSINQMLDDLKCNAPMRSIVRNMEKQGVPAWQYHFTRVRSDLMGKMYGAWHGSEVRFVFNSLIEAGQKPEPLDLQVADFISNYWVQFAKTGDPNRSDLPRWFPYHQGEEKYLEFGNQLKTKENLNKASVDLMSTIEAEQRANRRTQRAL